MASSSSNIVDQVDAALESIQGVYDKFKSGGFSHINTLMRTAEVSDMETLYTAMNEEGDEVRRRSLQDIISLYETATAAPGLIPFTMNVDKNGRGFTQLTLFSLLFSCGAGDIQAKMEKLRKDGTRQVCQYQFKKNDIVWMCKTCQRDETCVICNDCYQHSNHEGHDVLFYHSVAGGCCDCGDHDAWLPSGDCVRHGKSNDTGESSSHTHNTGAGMPAPMPLVASELFPRLIQEIHSFFTSFAQRFEPGNRDVPVISGPPPIPVQLGMYHVILYRDEIHTLEEVFATVDMAGYITETTKKISKQLFNEKYRAIGECCISNGFSPKQCNAVVKFLFDNGYRACSITDKELCRQHYIVHLIHWLTLIASINDELCSAICSSFTHEILIGFMTSIGDVPQSVAQAYQDMKIMLMANSSFKLAVAVAHAQSYGAFAGSFGKGVGLTEHSMFALSVQFLNKPSVVNHTVCAHALLAQISTSLLKMLVPDATSETNAPVSLDSVVFKKQRYSPVLSDIRIILSIPEMSRIFCSTRSIIDWIEILSAFQYMDPQARIEGVHVEYESSKWITSFNLYFGLCTIFDYLLNWLEEADSAVVVNKVWTVAELLGPCPRHGDQDSNDQTTPISLLNNTTGDATDEGHEYGGGNGTHLPLLSCMDLMDLLVTKARLWLINNCNERSSTVFPIIASRSSAATCSTDKTMSLPSFPVAFSFHILLPRFIACLIRECCKQSHLLDSLDHLSHHLQSATVLRGAVDVPQEQSWKNVPSLCWAKEHIATLSMASQIRSGWWVYNGNCMLDQLHNYAEQACCTVFMDLDILMVQFCMAGLIDGNTNAEPSTNEAATTFDGVDVESVDEVRSGSMLSHTEGERDGPSKGSTVSGCDNPIMYLLFHYHDMLSFCHTGHWNTPNSPLPKRSGSYRIALADELLVLVTLLVTTVPLPPASTVEERKDRLMTTVRQQVIHALIRQAGAGTNSNSSNNNGNSSSSSCTFSSLLQAVDVDKSSRYAKAKKDDHALSSSNCVGEVLSHVSHRKLSTGLEPDKYTLKDACWAEYDPTYSHVPRQVHQQAYELRPKVDSIGPMVGVLPPPHPAFKSLRFGVLSDTLVQHLIGMLVYSFTAKQMKFVGELYQPLQQHESSFQCSVGLFSRALHLLTLLMHELASSYSGESNTTATVIEHVYLSTVLFPALDVGSVVDNGADTTGVAVMKESNDAVDADAALSTPVVTPADTPAPKQATLLHLLLDVIRSAAVGDKYESNMKYWTQWLVKQCTSGSPACKAFEKEYIATHTQKKKSRTPQQIMEAKKKAAKERAMKAMAASAMSFNAQTDATHAEDVSDSDGDLDESRDVDAKDGGSESFNDQFYESAPECIICQLKEAKEGDMLGYIGFCQRSRVHSRYGVRRSCGEELCSASDGSDEVGVKAGLGMSSADSDDDSRVETPQPISTCTDTSTSHTNSHGQQKDNVLLNAIAVAEQLNPLEIHCTHKDSAFDNCDSEMDDVHVQFCGHAVHKSCLVAYQREAYRKNDASGGFLLDQSRHHFQCPLCKNIGSFLVPYISPPAIPSACDGAAVMAAPENAPLWEEGNRTSTLEVGGKCRWLSWIQYCHDQHTVAASDTDKTSLPSTALEAPNHALSLAEYQDKLTVSMADMSNSNRTGISPDGAPSSTFTGDASSSSTNTQSSITSTTAMQLFASYWKKLEKRVQWATSGDEEELQITGDQGPDDDADDSDMDPATTNSTHLGRRHVGVENVSVHTHTTSNSNPRPGSGLKKHQSNWDGSEQISLLPDNVEFATRCFTALQEMCEPIAFITGEPTERLDVVSVLLANARSIVFTLTMDEMSHGVGFHRHHTDTNSSVTSILSSSFDSLKPLPKVVQCMAVLMGETCSNLSPFVHRNMAAAWEGTCFSALHQDKEVRLCVLVKGVIEEVLVTSPSMRWLNHCLLQRPMLDQLFLNVVISKYYRYVPETCGKPSTDKHDVMDDHILCCFQWTCIASLVQQILIELQYISSDCVNHCNASFDSAASGCSDGNGDASSNSSAESASTGEYRHLVTFIRCIADEISLQFSGVTTQASAGTLTMDNGASINRIIDRWYRFLRTAMHVVHRLVPSVEVRGSTLPSPRGAVRLAACGQLPRNVDLIGDFIASAKLESFFEVLSEGPASTSYATLLQSVRVWLVDVLQCVGGACTVGDAAVGDTKTTVQEGALYSSAPAQIESTGGVGHVSDKVLDTLQSKRLFPYRHILVPSTIPVLVSLPSHYDVCHKLVMNALGQSKDSADASDSTTTVAVVCCICGEVVNGGGKGNCCAHAKKCSGDVGIFFLLQDCSMLMSHGPRCAYFAAPYVDEHGEKHNRYRGKPLQFDSTRYEMLRKLYESHSLAKEIVQKRSTSDRVVCVLFHDDSTSA